MGGGREEPKPSNLTKEGERHGIKYNRRDNQSFIKKCLTNQKFYARIILTKVKEN